MADDLILAWAANGVACDRLDLATQAVLHGDT